MSSPRASPLQLMLHAGVRGVGAVTAAPRRSADAGGGGGTL